MDGPYGVVDPFYLRGMTDRIHPLTERRLEEDLLKISSFYGIGVRLRGSLGSVGSSCWLGLDIVCVILPAKIFLAINLVSFGGMQCWFCTMKAPQANTSSLPNTVESGLSLTHLSTFLLHLSNCVPSSVRLRRDMRMLSGLIYPFA